MKNLSKLFGLLKFTRQDLNLENCLVHYKTYIEPTISYALIFSRITDSKVIYTILLLRKKIVRLISGKPLLAHSSELFELSSYLAVHELYASALIRFSLENFSFLTYSKTQKSTWLTSLSLLGENFFEKQVKKFSVEHRAIKLINNLKRSVTWSDDLVTSYRSAKKETFYCLINIFVTGITELTEFLK